jgi:transcriptional regulator with XRE-family HTH domain
MERPERPIYFAKNFRLIRKRQGLVQKDICRLSGISQSHLSSIERGCCKPSVETMTRLADVVNTPLWQLCKPDGYR